MSAKLEAMKQKATYDYQVDALAYYTKAGEYGHRLHMWCKRCGTYLGYFDCGHRWDWACMMAKGGNRQHMSGPDCNWNPPLYAALRGFCLGYANSVKRLDPFNDFPKRKVSNRNARLGKDLNLFHWRELAKGAKMKYYQEVA